jgi:hypothetical protein
LVQAHDTIVANSRFFGGDISKVTLTGRVYVGPCVVGRPSRFCFGDPIFGLMHQVPKSALTVGVGTVMDAREVLIIITGIHKAFALAQCIERGVSHM